MSRNEIINLIKSSQAKMSQLLLETSLVHKKKYWMQHVKLPSPSSVIEQTSYGWPPDLYYWMHWTSTLSSCTALNRKGKQYKYNNCQPMGFLFSCQNAPVITFALFSKQLFWVFWLIKKQRLLWKIFHSHAIRFYLFCIDIIPFKQSRTRILFTIKLLLW